MTTTASTGAVATRRRILLLAATATPDTMESHVLSTLATMGHHVHHFDIKRLFGLSAVLSYRANAALRLVLREPERLFERSILRTLDSCQPDIVLVLLGSSVSPKTVARMRRRYAGPIVCWCQDALSNLDRQYLIGAEYDHVFVKDRYMRGFLADHAGCKAVHYLPEACNPLVHRTVPLTAEDRARYGADICTFGSLYYYRQAILQSLAGYELKVWGNRPGWLVDRLGPRFMGRPVHELEKCKAIAASSITLNTLHYAEIDGLNCRAFEVAGCGGFQLMSHSPAAALHFQPDRELVTFAKRSELLEKVDHYLRHPEERAAIAAAGQARAYREHTYSSRLSELLRISLP